MSNAFKTYVVAAVALAAAGAGLTAVQSTQPARPDFSGVWTFAGPESPQSSAGGSVALRPEPITIRQTPNSIVIDRPAFGRTTTMTFTIGGTKDDTNRTGAQVWTTKTRWDGKGLVTAGNIAQNTSAGFEDWVYTETRTLDGRGHMIVETKYVAHDGKVRTGKQDWAPKKK